jgi:hypothetical protein
MKLVEEKNGTIEYDPTVPCITASFTDFMSTEQFKAFLEKGLAHLIEKKKSHARLLWLADTSKHAVQPEKDILWVAEHWNPRALRAGINHVAFVLPENVFAVRSVKGYAAKSAPKEDEVRDQEDIMTVEFFGKIEDAKEWFRNLKPVTAALK